MPVTTSPVDNVESHVAKTEDQPTTSVTSTAAPLPPELIARVFSHADPSTLLLALRCLSSHWRREIDAHVLPSLFGSGEWRVGLRIARKPRVGHWWRGQVWRGPSDTRARGARGETPATAVAEEEALTAGNGASSSTSRQVSGAAAGLPNQPSVSSTLAPGDRTEQQELPEAVQARRRFVEAQPGALEDELEAFPGNARSRASPSAGSNDEAQVPEEAKDLVHVLPLHFKGVVRGGLTFGTPKGEYHALFEHATLPRGFERGAGQHPGTTNVQPQIATAIADAGAPVQANGTGVMHHEAPVPAAAGAQAVPDTVQLEQQHRDNARLLLNFGVVWRFPGDGADEAEEWGLPDPEQGWLSGFYCSKTDVRPILAPVVDPPTLSSSEESGSESSDEEEEEEVSMDEVRGSASPSLSSSSAGLTSVRQGSIDRELLPSERIMLAEGIAPPPRSQQVTGHSTPIARRIRQMVDVNGGPIERSGFASARASAAASQTAPGLDWSDTGVEYIRLDLTLGHEFFARKSHRANRLLRRLQDEAMNGAGRSGLRRNGSERLEGKGKQRAKMSGSSTPGQAPVSGLAPAKAPSARSSGISTPSYSSAASTPLRPKALGGALARLAAQQAAVAYAPSASVPPPSADLSSHPASATSSPRLSELSLEPLPSVQSTVRPITPHKARATPRSSQGASTPSKHLAPSTTTGARLDHSSGRSTGTSTPARMQKSGTSSSAGNGRKEKVEASLPRAKFRAHLVKAEDLRPAEPSDSDPKQRGDALDDDEEQEEGEVQGHGWKGRTAWGTGAWRHAMLDTDQPVGLLWSWSR